MKKELTPKWKALILAALILFSLVVATSWSNNRNNNNDTSVTSSVSSPPANAPAETRVVPSASPEQVNINRFYSSEPAPMGITDFGIGPNGPYSYSTNSFLGIVHLNSLKTQNSTGDPRLSIQLNIVLQFVSKSGQLYAYWIQDAAIFNSTDNGIFFVDNVWNMSAQPSNLKASGISGTGKIFEYNSLQSYYATVAKVSLPGNGIHLKLPATVKFEANSTINSQGEAQVDVAYNDGFGWVTYDSIVFTSVEDIASDQGFVVNGRFYNPLGTFYDAELILGGVSSGWNTTNVQSDVVLQLEYWNGHNYQEIYNAFNFGSDTTEAIDNVLAQGMYFNTNGSLGAQISAGSGKLGRIYDQSQISIISVQSPFASGIFSVRNASSTAAGGTRYPFVGGDVNVTVAPGTYVLSIYNSNGILVAQETESVSAGQYLQLHVSSSSFVTFTLSYSTLGGTPTNAPTLTYFLNGQRITVQLSTTAPIYYLDPDSTWTVTDTLSGQTQDERWQTNQVATGIATADQKVNLIFYHQYFVSFNYTVVGGGSGFSTPTIQYFQFGNLSSTSAGSQVWADAGSAYSYPSTLSGSTQFERWHYLSGQALNGTISENSITIFYSHQYYVTIESPIPNSGSETPSSGWYDALSNLVLGETNSSGWGFGGWVGTGPGSYTGSESVRSLTVIGPITERAIFLPSLTISSTRGGSVVYSYGNISGTVQSGNNVTSYLQPGTAVTLTAEPSSFLNEFKQWSSGASGDKLSVNITTPTVLVATFSYNYLNIALIVGLPIVLIAIGLIIVRMRRSSET